MFAWDSELCAPTLSFWSGKSLWEVILGYLFPAQSFLLHRKAGGRRGDFPKAAFWVSAPSPSLWKSEIKPADFPEDPSKGLWLSQLRRRRRGECHSPLFSGPASRSPKCIS